MNLKDVAARKDVVDHGNVTTATTTTKYETMQAHFHAVQENGNRVLEHRKRSLSFTLFCNMTTVSTQYVTLGHGGIFLSPYR
jgi:hypothetical protein